MPGILYEELGKNWQNRHNWSKVADWFGGVVADSYFTLKMAQQAGPLYFTGCYDNICFYRMDGKYYARLKSSLTGKRVKKDPAFRETMRYAELLGMASKIASRVYRTMPENKKGHVIYRKLTGRAMLLLKEGKTEEEVIFILNGSYSKRDRVNFSKIASNVRNRFAGEVLYRIFSSSPTYDEVEVLCECEGLPP